MIVKERIHGKEWYVVRSHRTGRNLGMYKTRQEAQNRIEQLKAYVRYKQK